MKSTYEVKLSTSRLAGWKWGAGCQGFCSNSAPRCKCDWPLRYFEPPSRLDVERRGGNRAVGLS